MREVKNAVQMGHLANLSAVAASIPDGDRDIHPIGYVLGKARGVSFRANPNGDAPSKGLTGTFEVTPTAKGRAVMVTPLIFLPSSFTEMVAVALMGDQKAPGKAPPKGKPINMDGVTEVELALEIGVRKNSGAGVGYEFSVTQLTPDTTANDALAGLRKFLPKELAQTADLPALAAPAEKSKAKAKSKKK